MQIYTAMYGATYTDEKGRNWLATNYFPLAMQNDMLFEAMILHMYHQFPSNHKTAAPARGDFVSHRSSVLSKLHQRLSSKDSIDDTTIHTILSLMAADVCFDQPLLHWTAL